MDKLPSYEQARRLLLDAVAPLGTEALPLAQCAGRVLAQDAAARQDAPPFDRSAYDGYAFRACDVSGASPQRPVTLRVVGEAAAGCWPARKVSAGEAVKILTGAPVPPGADAVVMYEKTDFTSEAVTLFFPVESGVNVVRVGEDVRAGVMLARQGDVIDPGLLGTLAAQGMAEISVYRRPRVGVLSTGEEVVEPGDPAQPGRIYNANRYLLSAALLANGLEPVWLGTAGDDAGAILSLLRQGLQRCDAVLCTGGVSAGDYDLTPDAMEKAGAEILCRGVDIKPGMACALGAAEGRLILALSGNPASAMTSFYAVALPALKKLAGRRDAIPPLFPVKLAGAFPKKSGKIRFLRGKLDLSDGQARMLLPPGQGNAVLSSAIGCDMMAIVPAGSGPLAAGAHLQGFML